jgi:dTDP-glucose 4,6-dehydratase
MNTLIVMGGAGFVGSAFIRYWLNNNPSDRVVSYDLAAAENRPKSNMSFSQLDADRYFALQGDINDTKRLACIVERFEPRYVVNFAAVANVRQAADDPRKCIEANVCGVQTLLEAARGTSIERFHQVSTYLVYGDIGLDSSVGADETAVCNPVSIYAASKAAADMMVLAYHRSHGLKTSVSRCCNNYGPGQHLLNVIPRFIASMLTGLPVVLHGRGGFKRQWLHVFDHCRAIAAILLEGRTGEIYNVGGTEEMSVVELAALLELFLPKHKTARQLIDNVASQIERRCYVSCDKLTRELGWRQTIGFEEGLLDTVNWYRKNLPLGKEGTFIPEALKSAAAGSYALVETIAPK